MKKWIVTSAAISINLILGVLYIWSIVGKALMKELNWSSTQASLPYTVCIATFAFVMIFAGKLQDVKGPRLGALLGGLLVGSGLLLTGFVKSPLVMAITFGVMVGAGIGFGYASTTPAAVKWFPSSKKGLISGLVVSGVGFAAVYISPLTNMLITDHGISKTFIILGLGSVIILVSLSQFLVNPPAGYSAEVGSSHTSKKTSISSVEKRDFEWRKMLKTVAFYKLWIMYAFTASAGLMIIGHLAIIAKQQAKWENGFYLVVFLAIFNTLGRIIGGMACDKFGYIRVMRVTFLIQAVNMLLFNYYLSPTTLAIGAAFTGLSYGALFSIFPVTSAEFFGMKNLGVNYGLLFTSWGCAGVIGPLMAAKILDSTGSYNASYIISAALLIVAGIMTFTFVSTTTIKDSSHSIKTN